MPATYTYNDAIDDAMGALMGAWEEAGPNQIPMDFVLKIVGKLKSLKRPSRRKRSMKKPVLVHVDPSKNPEGLCWTVVETLAGETLSRTVFGTEAEARGFAHNKVTGSRGLIHLEGPVTTP